MQKILITLLLGLTLTVGAQDSLLVMHGRITCGGQGVPYATLQLLGTSIGVACNDDGEYTLKVPAGHEGDTVLIRSVGFNQVRLTVSALAHKGNVRLTQQNMALNEVEVKSYRTAQNLLSAAVKRIDSNYHQHTALSTFFYRDWRAVDGELYLFDEAVMCVHRRGYSLYADKRGYSFAADRREMGTNYKSLLKHRLLVYDRGLLNSEIGDPDGVDEMMSYADNEEFYDPVATPQASFSLSRRTLAQHTFGPVQEFTADGEMYYMLHSVGPGRVAQSKVSYSYIVRKDDLAIVRITAAQRPVDMQAADEAWIRVEYNRMGIDADSSVWCYDVRCGRYTLTRYYNIRSFHLGIGNRWQSEVKQRWQQCVDWTLTDFAQGDSLWGEVIAVKPQTVAGAFGTSDYSTDYWHRYNSIPIDLLPLRLLKEKLNKIKNE